MTDWQTLRINPDRFKNNFDQLAAIGATAEGGVHRPSLTETHLAARAWFRQTAEAAGLEFQVDGAGNHSAILRCGPEGAPHLLLGSHLDSVYNGGRFDGALGVLSALEAVQTIQDAGLILPYHLEVIDFTDEEGTLVGLLGSFALAGRLKAKALKSPRGGRQNLLDGLARAGLTEEGLTTAGRPAEALAGYLEVHIEQGLRLLNANTQIGIVTAIVGICSYQLTFKGRADHAGTTSMTDRLDAGQGASAFTLAARQLVLNEYPGCVVNVGQMHFTPGAYNIIPAEATLSLEFRGPQADQFKQLEGALLTLAETTAAHHGLTFEASFQGKHRPAPMGDLAQAAFASASKRLGLSHTPLASGAGHDAQSLAHLCPVGMIFVP